MSQTVSELNLFPHSWKPAFDSTNVTLIALYIYFLLIYSLQSRIWVSGVTHIKEISISRVQRSTVENSSNSFTGYHFNPPFIRPFEFSEFLNGQFYITASSANRNHTKKLFSLHLCQCIHTNDHLIIKKKCQEETKLTREQELNANQLLYGQYQLN